MTKLRNTNNKNYLRKDNNTMNIVDCNGIIIEGAHNQDMKDVMRKLFGAMSWVNYYPIAENWDRSIRPHLDNTGLQQVLVEDFDKYTMGRWGKRFEPGRFPRDFEDYDWTSDFCGSHPEYFRYVKHGASHWLVNWYLTLARLVEPERPWRILRTLCHSAVWDGEAAMFDPYGMALFECGAAESFVRAAMGRNHAELAPGELLKTYPPEIEANALGAGERPVSSPGEANCFVSQSAIVLP